VSLQKDSARFWQRLLRLADDGSHDVRFIASDIIPQCAALRPASNTKTGTMSLQSCKALYALSARTLPKVTVEIGTFIGTSTRTLALLSDHVYTCDKDNDLLPSFENGYGTITTYPKQTSTAMLADLVGKRFGGKVDLFFFDGRVQDEDLGLIGLLSNDRTVFAFDDYEGQEKGVVNVRRFAGHASTRRHEMVLPCPGTTIAALVPYWML
jgi:hypothetical protein